MPPSAWWVLFALVALSAIVGAKVLDDRDRRRFAKPGPGGGIDHPSGAITVPSSDPPSGTVSIS